MAARRFFDAKKVGRMAVQNEADFIAAYEIVEGGVATEFIRDDIGRGAQPYVRAVFGTICAERRTPEEGYAEACEMTDLYRRLQEVRPGLKLIHSFPLDFKITIWPGKMTVEDLEYAYEKVTDHHPSEDDVSEEQLFEALGMATDNEDRVRIRAFGHLELYADQPLLAKFPLSLQGAEPWSGRRRRRSPLKNNRRSP